MLEVRSPLPDDFCLPPNVRTVQFSEPLTADEFKTLAVAIKNRPEVLLRIYNTWSIADLQFLRYFPSIRRLSIDLWQLANLNGLSEIESLESFSLGPTKSKAISLSILSRFPDLKTLDLDAQDKDIDVIKSLRNLRTLTLTSLRIKELGFLEGAPLSRLAIKLGGATNIEVLASLKRLKYLELWRIRNLMDVDVVAHLHALEGLWLQALQHVTSLPSMCELRRLRWVYLEKMNGLRDLASVAEAPALEQLHLIDLPRLPIEALGAFENHASLRTCAAFLGSVKRNADASNLLKLPRPDKHPKMGVLTYPG